MEAVLYETVLTNEWIPVSVRDRLTIKQAQFLVWDGLEALFGGAGGGGKSFALLMGALQYVDHPKYHALILRRTFQQLAKAEAIMSVAMEWLKPTKAKWNDKYRTWRFPSGATLEFGHMDNTGDRFNYQGAAYRYVAYDELTQFEEIQYRYLFSRVRRAANESEGQYTIPLRFRSASNPGGIGHEWVKARFISPEPTPKRRFFPALLQDNKAPDGSMNIDEDSYRESLAELPELERRQIEEGDWDAFVGGRFDVDRIQRFTWVDLGEGVPGLHKLRRADNNQLIDLPRLKRILTVDPAASEKTTADYTVISAWAFGPDGELFWLGVDRGQWDLPDIVPRIQRMARIWEPHEVGIEAVAANNAVYKLARRTGMPVRKLSPTGPHGRTADKLVRATPAICYVEDGRLYIPRGDPLFPEDAVLGELRLFTGDEKQDAHDDIVDTLAYSVMRRQALDPIGAKQLPFTAGAFAKGRESDATVLSGVEDERDKPRRVSGNVPRVFSRGQR